MKQAEIKDRFLKTENELKNARNDEKLFLYATQTKYVKKLGYIGEMSFNDLLKAKKFLNNLNSNNFSKEMEELGITSDDINQKSTDKYLGVKVSVWEQDIKTRIEELRYNSRIASLENDYILLKKYLDHESIQEIDLANLSNVVLD